MRKRIHISNEDKTFCSKSCQFEANNPNPKKDKIKIDCKICATTIEVHESKYTSQENFFCSHQCYAKFRHEYYHGDKIYNYQDLEDKCQYCGENFETTEWNRKNGKKFCSQSCYWSHRKEHYKEKYYQSFINNERPETLIEKLIREWLDEHHIRYVQEFGFLRKYYLDFYIPDYKIVIEAYGDYWHSNPAIYDIYNNDNSKIALTNQQIKSQSWIKDKERKDEIEQYGYKVYELWETDIHNSLNEIMKNIFNQVSVTTERFAPNTSGEDEVTV